MKAQGLPINFIVIAALAILILILAAGFVVAGGSSAGSALAPQQFRTSCEDACAKLQTKANTMEYTVGQDPDDLLGSVNSKYCISQALKGQTQEINCYDYGVQCYVTFANGIQKQLDCSGATVTP